MPKADTPTAKLPLLLTVDGESKTAKTTATDAICTALKNHGWRVYEADAGSFFRRMTVCALETLGFDDLNIEDPNIATQDLYTALKRIIGADAAFTDRDWPNLQSNLVERYVSVVGNATMAQNAKEVWFDKITKDAVARKSDILVINSRNPRERLRKWQSPVLDMLVYCEPGEAARRILFARGIEKPSNKQLAAQTADVERRRFLDRNRDKYVYVDPRHVIAYEDTTAGGVEQIVEQSWSLDSVHDAAEDLPATIRLDTTRINLKQTKAIISALALAAVNYQRVTT